MKISQQEIEKIAHLARLEIQPEKMEELKESINRVIDWMDALNAVDTSNVEPLVHITEAMNHFREDEAKETLDREKALKLGPNTNDKFFKVPQVIE
jgi:aspartyl-tRNA(Asn)/glutamyl-tRNA(Gln) amidotransferase subunit C